MKSTSNGGEQMPRQIKRVDSIKARKTLKKKGGAHSQLVSQLIVTAVFFVFVIMAVSASVEKTTVYQAEKSSQGVGTTTDEQSIKTEEKASQKSKMEAKSTHKDTSSEHKEDMAKEIAKVFPENSVTMVAIALAENKKLDPMATSFNCRYKIGGKTFDTLTGVWIDLSDIIKEQKKGYVSTWCRSGHQKYAWSKDGGLLQVNDPKPEHYTISGNLSEARKRYDEKGLNAWTTYWSKEYLEYVSQAKKLLE